MAGIIWPSGCALGGRADHQDLFEVLGLDCLPGRLAASAEIRSGRPAIAEVYLGMHWIKEAGKRTSRSMKSPSPVKGNPTRWHRQATRFCARCALLLACGCLALGLFLPAVRNTDQGGRSEPRGQFYADWRTLVATARYLLQPESDVRPNLTQSHATGPWLVQGTNNRPFDLSTGFSNQMWHGDSWSNSPA